MLADVAIVGGGPAGCSAALTLLAKGYTVVLFDVPSSKEKPTETSPATLRALLQSLGAAEALDSCRPCYGISSKWGQLRRLQDTGITDPRGHSWFIDRTGFDQRMKDAVTRAGGKWIRSFVNSLSHHEESISLIASDKQTTARWVILASGSLQHSARLIHQQRRKLDSLLAFWTRLKAALPQPLLSVESALPGWWYACPDHDDGIIVCLMTDAPAARTLHLFDGFEWERQFGKTELCQSIGSYRRTAPLRTSVADLANLETTSGSRWTLAGDAAVKLDPLGSSGTKFAIDSGQRAASAVDQMLKGNLQELKRYNLWCQDLFQAFVRQRNDMYCAEDLNAENEFWLRRTQSSRLST